MLIYDIYRPVIKYSAYKNDQFNKKLAKMRTLIGSVNETSLKPEDKKKLLSQMKDLL